MRESVMLGRIASALRAFHDGRAIPGTFDSFRVVETYRRTALDRGGLVPDDFDWAHDLATRIETRRSAESAVPCHNDLLNQTPRRRRASVHCRLGVPPAWAIASSTSQTSHQPRAGRGAELALLSAYFDDVRDEDYTSARAHAFMSDFREAMWGVVRGGCLGARLRLQGLRSWALRATRPDGGVAAFHAALA
jgi:hypothetical protein